MRGQVVSLRQRMIEAKFFMTSARPSVFERLAWARRYLSAKVAHSLFLAAHCDKNPLLIKRKGPKTELKSTKSTRSSKLVAKLMSCSRTVVLTS
jgi:hypothetical protein